MIKLKKYIIKKEKKTNPGPPMWACKICDLVVYRGNPVENKLNKIMKLNYQTIQY